MGNVSQFIRKFGYAVDIPTCKVSLVIQSASHIDISSYRDFQ
jgi:hypothetical protein